MKYLILLLSMILWVDAKSEPYLEAGAFQIEQPDSWTQSLIGSYVYQTDFVLTDENSGDLMLLQILPKGFLFSDFTEGLTKQKVKTNLSILNSMVADDSFLKQGEVIRSIEIESDAGASALYLRSQFANSNRDNFMIIKPSKDHLLLMKIISKEEQTDYSYADLNQLLDAVNPRNVSIDHEIDETVVSPFLLKVMLPESMKSKADVEKDEDYPFVHLAFTEEDRLSIYMISSQCTDQKVPAELFAGMVLEDFGFDALDFNDIVIHRGKELPLMIGSYSISQGDFQMVSTVLSGQNCQHVAAYITEAKHSLLDRFLSFVDHIELKNIPGEVDLGVMDSGVKDRMVETLNGLGHVYLDYRDYPNAIKFYQAALDVEQSEDLFFDLLNAYYDSYQYEQVLQLISDNQDKMNKESLEVWRAWSLAKLNRNVEAISSFKKVLSIGVKDDQDFFKYIELLSHEGQIDLVLAEVEKYNKQISNKAKLDFKVAELMVKHKLDGAKSYLVSILNKPLVVKSYQFDVMDLLAELEAYHEILDFCQKQIDKGFETYLILNYLGDAQNQLGMYEAALASMQKSHDLSPRSKNIKSYLELLKKKVGKADLTEMGEQADPVKLPEVVLAEINELNPKHINSSYEYLYQVDAYFHEQGKNNKKTKYGKIKINNKGGVLKNKTLRFAFNNEYENITVNSFKVYDENGNILSELDQSTVYITNDDDGMLADHDKLLNIPVPSLRVGAEVEWVVTIANKSVNQTQEFVEMLFVSRVAHQYKGLMFSGDLTNISIDVSDDVTMRQLSDQTSYWHVSNLANYKKTPLLPDMQNVFPWIKLASVDESWVKAGDDYLALIDNKLNADMSDILLKFGVGFTAKDDLSKAIAITAYVQNQLSYQAIEFGWRAWVPNSSDQTLSNQYGDCKDHAVLLYDLLNAAGIKANLVLVNTENDISLKLTNLDQFDHMIVYLPEINSGVFVDVTNKDTYFDMLSPPSGLQGYHSLILEQGQSKTKQIPYSSPEYNVVEVNRTVDMVDDQFQYTEKARFKGYMAASLRRYLKGIELDEIESRIFSWVSGYYPDVTLEHFSYNNLYELSKPLELTFEFSQHKKYAAIKLPVFIERYVMEFAQSPDRIWDFEFKSPFQVKSITQVEKSGRLKFDKKSMAVNDELMNWEIKATKKAAHFKAEVFANKKSAEAYQKLFNNTKLSYITLERLID